MRKCSHIVNIVSYFTDVSRRCVDCGALLSMGPSNDAPVGDEMRAAEIAADQDSDQSGLAKLTAERWGWIDHREASAGHEEDMVAGYHAGWLAREIATHDDREARDEDCWAWDITRPIAEQWPNVPASEDDIPPSFRRSGGRLTDEELIAKVMATTGIDRAGAEQALIDGRRIASEMVRCAAAIDWPGYIGAEKPTGDPLDAETRAQWNADLDAVERGS